MSVGKLNWDDCASCTHYDKKGNVCKSQVWGDSAYLEVDGNRIYCICYDNKELK